MQQALAGELRVEALTEAEAEMFFAGLGEALRNPPPSVCEHYAALGAVPGAVGDDADGILCRRTESGGAAPIEPP